MKFESSIQIDAPLEFVVDHFRHRSNLTKWHPDLTKIEPLDGQPGTTGSRTLLKFKHFEMVETVLENELPDRYLGDYDTPGICKNTLESRFENVNGQTVYRVRIDYQKFNWMMRLMSILMPWMLKGQVRKFLKKFRDTVESEYGETESA